MEELELKIQAYALNLDKVANKAIETKIRKYGKLNAEQSWRCISNEYPEEVKADNEEENSLYHEFWGSCISKGEEYQKGLDSKLFTVDNNGLKDKINTRTAVLALLGSVAGTFIGIFFGKLAAGQEGMLYGAFVGSMPLTLLGMHFGKTSGEVSYKKGYLKGIESIKKLYLEKLIAR